MARLITIWWRDIPMQVIAKEGRQTEKRVLDKRFQFAVDKAAMNAGKKSYGDYIEEMQRSQQAADGNLTELVDAEMARIEAAYTKDVLHRLIASGGVGDRL